MSVKCLNFFAVYNAQPSGKQTPSVSPAAFAPSAMAVLVFSRRGVWCVSLALCSKVSFSGIIQHLWEAAWLSGLGRWI